MFPKLLKTTLPIPSETFEASGSNRQTQYDTTDRHGPASYCYITRLPVSVFI